MTPKNKKHSFYADTGSTLEVVMSYIKATEGMTLKSEIEDWANMMHYPYALHKSGASFEAISTQALESIRRLNQEISSLHALINTLAIAQGHPPIVPLSGASVPVMSQSIEANIPASTPTSEAIQPEAISPQPESIPEGKTQPKQRSKFVADPF